MRRIIIATIVSTVIIAAGTFSGVRQYTQASNAVTAYDADVNHDGYVTAQDAQKVWSLFGQQAALPTPMPQIVGNRQFVRRGATAGGVELIDTSTGAAIRSFGSDVDVQVLPPSCDNKYAVLGIRAIPGSYQDTVLVVDTRTGATVASPSTPGGSQPGITLNAAVFPCALRIGGATIAGGTPAQDRVAIAWTDVYDGCPVAPCPPVVSHVAIMDLATGQTVYTAGQTEGFALSLNCAHDTLYYQNTHAGPPPGTLYSVRLVDGTATALPETQRNVAPPC